MVRRHINSHLYTRLTALLSGLGVDMKTWIDGNIGSYHFFGILDLIFEPSGILFLIGRILVTPTRRRSLR